MAEKFEIRLASNIDQQYAQQLLEEINANIDNYSTFSVDASEVERIGTPGAQVLISLNEYCRQHNFKINVTKPSPQFIAAFRDLGLDVHVQEWGL